MLQLHGFICVSLTMTENKIYRERDSILLKPEAQNCILCYSLEDSYFKVKGNLRMSSVIYGVNVLLSCEYLIFHVHT